MSDAPPVSPATEDELPFKRQPMVSWFRPAELARAGIKAVLSKLFGAYADNREIQALRTDLDESTDGALAGRTVADYSGEGDVWFDYVADLGDGWDPTYAVAQMLASTKVEVDGLTTKRGRFLVMGGDQVYPTASKTEYRDRLEGPYRSALPYVDPAGPHAPPPDLYAVPGNHDWYDGLTSFTRFFCQGRWIGAWKTRQSRSYFALKLPHDWWLWGIDVQLEADIDAPQMRYFEELGAAIPAGANIILCVAEPTWLSTDRKGIEAYDNLSVFEDKAIRRHGHDMVVGLAGDLHTYARYRSVDGRLRFVSGGGGAYLYPTHRLPKKLTVPTAKPTDRTRESVETFTLGKHGENGTSASEGGGQSKSSLFPPPGRSHAMAARSLLFARHNKGFALFFGFFYLVLTWLLESASLTLTSAGRSMSFLRSAGEGFIPMIESLGEFVPHAPLAVLTLLLLTGGLISFADARRTAKKVALGLAHTATHVIALLCLVWLFMQFQLSWLDGLFGDSPGLPGHVIVFSLLMLTLGSAAAGVVWGIYLFGAHWLGKDTHSNDVFACQSIPDYKHVLRFHVTEDGLEIYPLGLESVPKRWRYRPHGTDGEPWFEPDDGKGPVPDRAVLIEPPIHVRRSKAVRRSDSGVSQLHH